MARRSYLCYGCEKQFGIMVDLNGNSDIQCSQCGSDFVEEMKSIQENSAPVAQAIEPQLAEMFLNRPPIVQTAPASIFLNRPPIVQTEEAPAQQIERQLPVQQESNQTAPVVNQEQRRWTRSMTIIQSHGGEQPSVQTFTSDSGRREEPFPSVNINNTNNFTVNMPNSRNADPINMIHQILGGMFRDEQEQPQSRGVSEEFLENLPEMKSDKEADCNICLEKVGTNGSKTCELPCGHAFDKNCLSGWLKDHDNCPCCRTKLDQGRAPQASNEEQQQQPEVNQIPIHFLGFM